MPDSSALWLESDPMHERRFFSKYDGYQAWISPRDLQPLVREAPALAKRQPGCATKTPYVKEELLTITNTLTRHWMPLTIDGTEVRLSCIRREGAGLPLVFLHGFGSTKEDYADVALHPAFAGRPIFAYDAPGCGESECSDLDRISIPFLVNTALAALAEQGIDRFDLVGHSMGGLTSLMLAHQAPERVVSLTDIEGNVAPEDCFLSRQIFLHPHEDPDQFLEDFIARNWAAPYYSSPLYATSVRYKVRAGAVRGIFESMVDLSDNANLMDKFLALPLPRMFMYGEQNNTLSYLAHLESNGVVLAEIAHSGHFPMYSNAPEMWHRIAAFHARANEPAAAAETSRA